MKFIFLAMGAILEEWRVGYRYAFLNRDNSWQIPSMLGLIESFVLKTEY